MEWRTEKAFKDINQTLTRAPALGLPSLKKSFILHVAEKQGVILGILIQRLGEVPHSIVRFSKQLVSVTWGLPGSLWTVAATALLVEEANKLNFHHSLEVQTLIKYKGV